MKNNHRTTQTTYAERDLNASVRPELTPVSERGEAPASPKNAPLHKARLGRLHLTIWMREDKRGTVKFSLKLGRSYKTESGYAETSSLDRGDLANAITLLTEAQAVLPPAFSFIPHAL